MSPLLSPVRLGALSLPNRIVMSPLTRCRAEPGTGAVPAMMVDYYAQRASAGLIVSEGIPVSPMGVGYRGVSGLWTEAQTAGWRRVTAAVHAAGGRIVAQLWHVGRLSDPVHLGGRAPVAPSALPAEGTVTLVRPKRGWQTPRALETAEVAGVVAEFAEAARNALRAGFDGVEVHGANGYLIDQFLQAGSNRRADRYGGGVENRARLLLEIVDALIPIWGADRIGVHLSPRDGHSMSDPDPAALFGHVAEALGRRRLAFLFAREAVRPDSLAPMMRRVFGGPLIANEKLTPESAAALVAAGEAEAAAFGKLFIANPDLPARIAAGAPLATPDPAGFYARGPEGYVDYPTLAGAI
ncbi:alkene reductase [Albimonas pacifica]|uniref:NADH:flavin oxidoreductase/NADH oxidase N-terminal domain-containing protein n=1 Tax=Albimonas pacifica TaxID=1114924 RepID=A0A1I3BNG8_9RHOB|nr:alkene reductase [Albimonas pacifica]SFH63835.1 hypothetical protein SAMN05216258_101223 [Albimonas pacifica]